jgi:hypothetical protein
LIMLDNDRSRRIAVYLSGDSKSTVRKDMRVQVPPSVPKIFPTMLKFLSDSTLAAMPADCEPPVSAEIVDSRRKSQFAKRPGQR